MLPLATITRQRCNRRIALAYAVDRGDHSFARHPNGEVQQCGGMGAELSKRKHKDRKTKWVDKETWTGQSGEVQEQETGLQMVDKENQCVLQWIQSITAEEEITNLDDRPPKRPHSEICMRQLNHSLEAMVGKIDLSCCDWLHRVGLQLPEPKPHPAMDQSDEVRQASIEGSTPEAEIVETISLGSLPEVGPIPEGINRLTQQETEKNETRADDTTQNKMVDILIAVADGDEGRKMSYQASSVAKLKVAIAEHSVKPKPKKRRPV
ncbi:hypothetical protein TcWFU_005126 [Taenia crassiceps]|uniref:Uncharacterized protein n=1 Tax=Taenia crassiceps TaxID=6207 RepID=A0ABR4QAV8_9CEST